jgi:hypothetical protein
MQSIKSSCVPPSKPAEPGWPASFAFCRAVTDAALLLHELEISHANQGWKEGRKEKEMLKKLCYQAPRRVGGRLHVRISVRISVRFGARMTKLKFPRKIMFQFLSHLSLNLIVSNLVHLSLYKDS